MSYDVVLERCPDGTYLARCEDVEDALSTGASRREALERLKQQILYQIEYCPCSYVDIDSLEVDVTEVEAEECSL